MNKRRAARNWCFQFFFHYQLPIFEIKSSSSEIENDFNLFLSTHDENLDDEQKKFALAHIKSTIENKDEVLKTCEKNLKNWTFSRLAKVDQTILLLYTNEIISLVEKTPKKVIINEAIELAKSYGTEESPKFINATLDTIAIEYKLK